jgi:hypothetical protein
MNTASILQYATLLSLLIGGLSVGVAVLIHREQVKTQIFLELSARYDELLQSSSTSCWLNMPMNAVLPERTGEFTISTLRFCTLVSLAYYLFRERRIPKPMWHLMLSSVERRMRTPLFLREWEDLKSEFESFPEFVVLVTSVQKMEAASERNRLFTAARLR